MLKKYWLWGAVCAINSAIATIGISNETSLVGRQVDDQIERANEARRVGRYRDGEKIAKQALDLAEERLGIEHPKTIEGLDSAASIQLDLGRYAEAETLYREALHGRAKRLGEDHPDTLNLKNDLASALQKQARYDEAATLYWETLRARRDALGNDHPDALGSMNDLARLFAEQGRYSAAQTIIGAMHDRIESRLKEGDADQDVLLIMHNLGVLYTDHGRWRDAQKLLSRTLDMRCDLLGEDHPDTLESLLLYGGTLYYGGRYDELEPLLWDTLRRHRNAFGPEHSGALTSLNNLGFLYDQLGRPKEAIKLLSRSLELRRMHLGDGHPDTISSMRNLAGHYTERKRFKEAEALYWKALKLRRQHLGHDHPDIFEVLDDLIWFYDKQGLDEQSGALLAKFAELVQQRRETHGDSDLDTLSAMNDLAVRYQRVERYDEAETLLTETIERRQNALGRQHPATLDSSEEMAWLLKDRGRNGDAVTLMAETLRQRQQTLGGKHPDTMRAMHLLAWLHYNQDDYKAARFYFRQALQSRRNVFGNEHPHTLNTMDNLAGQLMLLKEYRPALTLRRDILQIHRQALGEHHVDTLNAMASLQNLYSEWGRDEKAMALHSDRIQLETERMKHELAALNADYEVSNGRIINLSMLFFEQGQLARGKNYVFYSFIPTIIPALLLLVWLARSNFFGKPGHLIWISAAVFMPILYLVGLINFWAKPFFEDIENAWIASLRAIVQVGPVEELAKLITVIWVCRRWALQNRPLTIIAVGLAVGLSFAALENWDYAIAQGLYSPIIRSVQSLPTHLVMAGCGAGFLALSWRYPQEQWRYRCLAILVPALLHGSYDYLLFVEDHIPTVRPFSKLVSTLVIAIGAATLTRLIVGAVYPPPPPTVVERIALRSNKVITTYITIAVFGIIMGAVILTDLSIGLYATIRTAYEVISMTGIDLFPFKDVLSTMLYHVMEFADLVMIEKDGDITPLSGVELATIPTIATSVIVAGIAIYRSGWRRLMEIRLSS